VPLARALSTRLLLLTILAVMVAEVLIFVPSVANFRLRYLQDRLNTASVAAAAFTGDNGETVSMPVDVLVAADIRAIVVRRAGMARLIVVSTMPDHVDQTVWPTMDGPVPAIADAFATFLFGGDMVLRVLGEPSPEGRSIEVVLGDGPLRAAMFVYARNVGLLALAISLIAAGLVYAAIDVVLIRPIRRMTRAMLAFADDPEDASRILRPSGRHDELGRAERELAAMQERLRTMLGAQRHLADLGLAVSKINHDMRNLLSGAQLLSDRLNGLTDPAARRFAGKLMAALDRAISYSERVLAYGRAQEPAPQRRRLRLRPVVDEVFGLTGDGGTTLVNDVAEDFEIDADPEQLYRILSNLARNAVQAMAGEEDPALVRRVEIAAQRLGERVRVTVADTGPGLPDKARRHLFAAFRGSARAGGTGLGLAIAQELARAHGGEVELAETAPGRTVFAVTIPDRPSAPAGRRLS